MTEEQQQDEIVVIDVTVTSIEQDSTVKCMMRERPPTRFLMGRNHDLLQFDELDKVKSIKFVIAPYKGRQRFYFDAQHVDEAFLITKGNDCPTTSEREIDGIKLQEREGDTVLKIRNPVRLAGTYRFALRFKDGDTQQIMTYDPRIRNGGGGTSRDSFKTLYVILGVLAVAALAVLGWRLNWFS